MDYRGVLHKMGEQAFLSVLFILKRKFSFDGLFRYEFMPSSFIEKRLLLY